MVIKMLFLED